MPRQVQRGTEALALARHYNLKGKLPLQLDETIVPVHVVGDLASGSDPRAAAVLFSVGAPAAGNATYVGIENPVDSGIIARVSLYEVVSEASHLFIERIGPAGFALVPASTSATHWADTSLDGLPAVRAIAGELTPPAPLNGPMLWQDPFQTHRGRTLDPILYPGGRLYLVTVALNVPHTCSFAWTEEDAEPSAL